MKVNVPGHNYSVANFENPDKDQTIQFIHKEPTGTICDGTTNEELLKVLIDRTKYLNEKFPCRENSIAITKMQEALMWFNERTIERLARGVEGRHVR